MPAAEVQKLQSEIKTLVERYSNTPDPEIQKIIKQLKRSQKKIDCKDIAGAGFKILWLADKVRIWLDDLQ
ncbi:MAG TPA: hypothetical protein VK195_19600 [Burkholderiaceae bacterium]|nr:hypothetical protein [Burkholderiaceae bacterium]